MDSNCGGDEWLQCYEQQVREMGRSVNALSVTSSSESFPGYHVSAPETAAGRRSRASRRAKPTTLLNANPSNFRAIVQQFTGCSSGGANSVRRRGPVTLNFGSPSSVSEEDIFPRSGGGGGNDGNHDNTLHRGAWQENGAAGGKGTTPYPMGRESGLTCHGSSNDDHYHKHNHHDHHDDVRREYSGNNSSDDITDRIYMDNYDYIPQDELFDTTMFEEFTMGDLDRMLD